MAEASPLFLTPKELAARWRKSLSSIYRLAETGHLTCYRLGGNLRFRRDDVEAYERAGCQPALVVPLALRRRERGG